VGTVATDRPGRAARVAARARGLTARCSPTCCRRWEPPDRSATAASWRAGYRCPRPPAPV